MQDGEEKIASDKSISIGLDSCLIPIRDNLFMIQSTDFFYPLIDDPYMMGKITCANVVSDVYATGVTNIDSLTMIISYCDRMTDEQRNKIMPLIIKGFQDNAKLGNIEISLNNAVINPWCMIGGTATSICRRDEYISPLNAEIGDVLVLTKPLGAQMACNVKRWCDEGKEKWSILNKLFDKNEAETAYANAITSLARLNLHAAILMHKYKAHGATDVTGFGILGHAENLAQFQQANVKFVLHTLPILKHMLEAAGTVKGGREKFLSGRTPETSGGLLIAMSKESAESYCKEIYEIENFSAWIVGDVIKGDKTAEIIKDVKIIEVVLPN